MRRPPAQARRFFGVTSESPWFLLRVNGRGRAPFTSAAHRGIGGEKMKQTASKCLRQNKYTQKNKHLICQQCSNVFLHWARATQATSHPLTNTRTEPGKAGGGPDVLISQVRPFGDTTLDRSWQCFLWVNMSERWKRLNCSHALIWRRKWCKINDGLNNAGAEKGGCGSQLHPFPHYLYNPSNLPPPPPWKKKTLQPPLLLLLLLLLFFSSPHRRHHPPPTPFSPQPLSLLQDFAVQTRNRCLLGPRWKTPLFWMPATCFSFRDEGSQLAFLWSQSPPPKKSRGGKKQTLQMPSSAFKSSTYMSAPFCLHHHVQLPASSMSVTCLFYPHIIWTCMQKVGKKKWWDAVDSWVLLERSPRKSTTNKWKTEEKWPEFQTCGSIL